MNADADREAFREQVAESERHLRNGDADAANAVVDGIGTLIEPWKASGDLVDLLAPLIVESETLPVRYQAAACLLFGGHPDAALPMLESIRDGYPEAGIVLDYWRREHGQASPGLGSRVWPTCMT
ncbi:MAG: hypothetical protein ACRDO1_14615 [Nocardioidaceae bacterium]